MHLIPHPTDEVDPPYESYPLADRIEQALGVVLLLDPYGRVALTKGEQQELINLLRCSDAPGAKQNEH